MNNIIDLHEGDCIEYMKKMGKKSVDLLLTDIPYNEVNRKDNGLRNLDKGVADSSEFDLEETLKQFMRITRGSIYVFCGIEQVSYIKKTFRENGLSTRLIVWEKTNPSPMNGNSIWLSSVECCVYGKFPKATFNEHCKSSVLRFPCGRSKIHPTQKPVALYSWILSRYAKPGYRILDTHVGSASSLIACHRAGLDFWGFEIDPIYFAEARKRLEKEQAQVNMMEILREQEQVEQMQLWTDTEDGR